MQERGKGGETLNRWICCTFHAAGSCVQCLSLVYLVSLLVMGTYSGLPLQLGLGIPTPSHLRLRAVFGGKPHWEMGGGRKWGNLACTVLDKVKGLGLYK